MEIFLAVVLFIVTVAMIGIILIQKSEGQGLSGMAGGSSSKSFMSARSGANILTHTTAILATCFFVICLLMATIASRTHQAEKPLFEEETLEGQDVSDPLLPTPAAAPKEVEVLPEVVAEVPVVEPVVAKIDVGE